jgi:hypothetical protein
MILNILQVSSFVSSSTIYCFSCMISHLLAILDSNGVNKYLLIILNRDIKNMIVSRDTAVKE